jgi:ankyrin repeat protein
MSTATPSNKRNRQQIELERALHARVRERNWESARDLVQNQGVSIDCTNEWGHTSLVNYIDLQRRDLTTPRFLLDMGANVNAEALFDVPIGNPKEPDYIQVHATVLGYAVFVHSTHVVELLLEYGANSNTKIKKFGGLSCWDLEFSPLGLAIRNGDLEVVTFLLRAGANTAATLFAGDTHSTLFLACHYRNLPIVQCILEHGQGVDVNVIFPSRNSSSPVMLSPLCMACKNNNLEMAQLLVARTVRKWSTTE